MAPKKREKDADGSKTLRNEQIQTDHELFLQAFEKPTQIYRFLRTRNLVSPIFLNRTLTYMRHRMSRSHKGRKDFGASGMLEKIFARQQKDNNSDGMGSYMTLTFTSFHDKVNKGVVTGTVSVETSLLKLCHKKRKDVSSPVFQMLVGRCDVLRNPDTTDPPSTAPAVSVPSDNFRFNNGHLVKSYVLLFRVAIALLRPAINGIYNGSLSDADEPAQKKRKSIRGPVDEVKVYGAELIVYDKHRRCLLSDGDYELVLQEMINTKVSPRKRASWETVDGREKIVGPFDIFNKGPTLTFRLSWSDTPANAFVAMPKAHSASGDVATFHTNNNNHYNHNHVDSRPVTSAPNGLFDKKMPSMAPDSSSWMESMQEKSEKKTRIFYQFLYNNNTRQQTEAREDLHCPWCSLNCVHLYSLLKHLKLCHSRFIFAYVPHPRGARIDVSINESYDGSYSGNPHDLHTCPPGFAFSRSGPVRRTPVTNVMVCHPKRTPPSLSEFLEPEDSEYDGPRPYITGHNRLYHHTGSCLPIRPQEIENDSEGENDPEWLQIKTRHMIDEFTDVNEGEKELMKMWNLHVMNYGFVGDCQIPLACSMFVEVHGREIIEKRLYHNFILHMCNLFDFGLIGAAVIFRTIRQLQVTMDRSRCHQSLRCGLSTCASVTSSTCSTPTKAICDGHHLRE